MTISKISSYLLYLLMAISVILVGWFYFGGYVSGTEGTPAEEPIITNQILLWSFMLVIITALSAIVFPVIYIIANPKNAIRTLIILAIVGLLILIAYQLASDELLNIIGYSGPDNVPSTLKLSGAALNLTSILAGLAILSILYTEISKFFK